ncbi:hypothetical protein GALMADRAFT_146497 [Galerina marginata CBS 339.88]|uniref:Uncharacterized protein n=1 Tax=Galerina marginata (strain CBS 339.88) TaxID=685588 RepID=A0A067SBM1_GALM3|nr:hypothetical protein GALMADRAFT_146497 [Galerina marginata CBS 339.88]
MQKDGVVPFSSSSPACEPASPLAAQAPIQPAPAPQEHQLSAPLLPIAARQNSSWGATSSVSSISHERTIHTGIRICILPDDVIVPLSSSSSPARKPARPLTAPAPIQPKPAAPAPLEHQLPAPLRTIAHPLSPPTSNPSVVPYPPTGPYGTIPPAAPTRPHPRATHYRNRNRTSSDRTVCAGF